MKNKDSKLFFFPTKFQLGLYNERGMDASQWHPLNSNVKAAFIS